MGAACEASRRDGTRCSAAALTGGGFCFAHDDSKRAQRDAARRKGGRNHATLIRASKNLPPELAEVQRRLIQWLDAVEKGELTAAQAGALSGIAARILEYGKYAFETAEARQLEERLSALEQRAAEGGRR